MITITRERLLKIQLWRETYGPGSNVVMPAEEAEELARIALAAMDSEPFAYIIQDKYERERGVEGHLSRSHVSKYVSHEDINEHEITCTPLYVDPRPELTSDEPVAWLLSGGGTKNVVCFDSGNAYADPLREVTPLYRHAQPAPVVPDEKCDDDGTATSEFDHGWNACRAAMLNGGKS